jgi:hypothetical protein
MTDQPHQSEETVTKPVSLQTLKVGGRYNWRNQPERLIYTGMCEPRNGRWHQFEKVAAPGVVWCEVLGSDLHMLEETADGVPGDQQ